MNAAVFFQKNDKSIASRILKRMYRILFLRTNNAKVKYLRDAGAKIGTGVNICSIELLGTEPYLIEIGDNTFFAGGDIVEQKY